MIAGFRVSGSARWWRGWATAIVGAGQPRAAPQPRHHPQGGNHARKQMKRLTYTYFRPTAGGAAPSPGSIPAPGRNPAGPAAPAGTRRGPARETLVFGGGRDGRRSAAGAGHVLHNGLVRAVLCRAWRWGMAGIAAMARGAAAVQTRVDKAGNAKKLAPAGARIDQGPRLTAGRLLTFWRQTRYAIGDDTMSETRGACFRDRRLSR